MKSTSTWSIGKKTSIQAILYSGVEQTRTVLIGKTCVIRNTFCEKSFLFVLYTIKFLIKSEFFSDRKLTLGQFFSHMVNGGKFTINLDGLSYSDGFQQFHPPD